MAIFPDVTPPSISILNPSPARGGSGPRARTLSSARGMNCCPPNPGFTLMTSTKSTTSSTSSSVPTGVAGLITTPAAALAADHPQGPVQVRAGFLMNRDQVGAGLDKGGRVAIRVGDHQVNVELHFGHLPQPVDQRRPHRHVGNKVPVHDVDVQHRHSAPLHLAISSPRRAKSAEKIDGTISIIGGLLRWYHSSVKSVPGVAARQAPKTEPAVHRTSCTTSRFPRARANKSNTPALRRGRAAPARARAGGPAAVAFPQILRNRRHLISGFRPIVPVPKQGASTRIRSKRCETATTPCRPAPPGGNPGRLVPLSRLGGRRTPPRGRRLRGLGRSCCRARRRRPETTGRGGPPAAARWIASRCPACGKAPDALPERDSSRPRRWVRA